MNGLFKLPVTTSSPTPFSALLMPLAALLALTTALGCARPAPSTQTDSVLWYETPARYWNSQALHLGNGFLGASFFGGVEQEVFALTEASVWTGEPAMDRWHLAGVNPRARESLPEIREAVTERNVRKADSLVRADFMGHTPIFGYFSALGDLRVDFTGHDGERTGYRRSLDLLDAIGTVTYQIDGVSYEREYFASYPDRVLAMRVVADTPGAVTLQAGMELIHEHEPVHIDGNVWRVRGAIPGNDRPYEVHMIVRSHGGQLGRAGDRISVSGADSVEIYLTAATNYALAYPDYTGEDPAVVAERIMSGLQSRGYHELRERHLADFRSLTSRVHLRLGTDPVGRELPTNERLERMNAGADDPGLLELGFNLGRYMLISSSRPGALASNLAGVWNGYLSAPWAGNYQSNINLQQNYQGFGPLDLDDPHEAYIDWIEDLSHSGREIARRVYGTGGWVSHTTGNIWGHAAPAGDLEWGLYPSGATWHARHVWDHYDYSRDLDYLRERGYALLRGVAQFWMENLIPFEGGLIAAPTASAEHGALYTEEGYDASVYPYNSPLYHFTMPGAYQDIQMIGDLFDNTARAARLLGDHAFADSVEIVRGQLLPLRIGQHGQLQEWYDDIDHPDNKHRHLAHLYAVYPGEQINPYTTPELAEAARVSMNMRGEGRQPQFSPHVGGAWSMAHRISVWVRLHDGDRAWSIYKMMMQQQGFENLLIYQQTPGPTASFHEMYAEEVNHANFCMDANGALPGSVAEMLVQTYDGVLHLLPALPGALDEGEITGLRTRGGYRVSLSWKNGSLEQAVVAVPEGMPVPQLRLDDMLFGQGQWPDNVRVQQL